MCLIFCYLCRIKFVWVSNFVKYVVFETFSESVYSETSFGGASRLCFSLWMHYGSDCKFVKYNDHLDGLLYLYK